MKTKFGQVYLRLKTANEQFQQKTTVRDLEIASWADEEMRSYLASQHRAELALVDARVAYERLEHQWEAVRSYDHPTKSENRK